MLYCLIMKSRDSYKACLPILLRSWIIWFLRSQVSTIYTPVQTLLFIEIWNATTSLSMALWLHAVESLRYFLLHFSACLEDFDDDDDDDDDDVVLQNSSFVWGNRGDIVIGDLGLSTTLKASCARHWSRVLTNRNGERRRTENNWDPSLKRSCEAVKLWICWTQKLINIWFADALKVKKSRDTGSFSSVR